MKKYLLILLVVIAFAAIANAQKVSREETEVRVAITKWAAAVKERDPKALDAIFADDLFITDFSGNTRGKKEELEVLKPSATMKTVSVTNEDIAVRILNKNNVVVTAIVRMAFDIGGKQSSMAMRYTSVWEKRKGNWQIIVLQTARVAPPKN